MKTVYLFDPKIGDWKDYVDKNNEEFFETKRNGEKKALPVPPHTIYDCIDNAQELLENMIGICEMKEHVNNLIYFVRYNFVLKSMEHKPHKINLHSIFSGNPGTGKTTLASILGSLLKEAGILSKGHVVMCNRASFCSGSLFGDTEKDIHKLVTIAQGGVLFIDEAYNLISPHHEDPSHTVLPNLLTTLGDETNRDLCVVLAGYPKEMETLMKTNPGLDSRFPNKFNFRDYSIEELMKITSIRLETHGYTFTATAKKSFKRQLEQLYNSRSKSTWGNARTVANLLEKTYLLHATRVIKTVDTDILKIKNKDIPKYNLESKPTKSRIGFAI